MSRKYNPQRDIESCERAICYKQYGDYAHCFLRIVGTVGDGIEKSGEQLKAFEIFVDL